MQPTQLSLFASPYCASCPARGKLCRDCDTARGCREGGPQHPHLLHPMNPDWIDRFTEVNGLDLGTVVAVEQAIPSLPPYIPRIRINAEIRAYSGIPAFALSLREVERLAVAVRETGTLAKGLLGIPEDHLLLVLGFEKDDYLEKVWPWPRRRELLAAIRTIRPDLATAWGYSVWYRHAEGWIYPRIEQLNNIKRSLVTYQNLQSMGIPAIPHVYWGDCSDLDRWVEWLSENPSVSTIAVDLQTTDSCGDWATALRGIAYLRRTLPRKVKALFNGPSKPERIGELAAIWPDCSITSFAAYFSAINRFKPMFGLRASWTIQPPLLRGSIVQLATEEYSEIVTRSTSTSRRMPKVSWDEGGAIWANRFLHSDASWPMAEHRGNGTIQLGLPLGTSSVDLALGVA